MASPHAQSPLPHSSENSESLLHLRVTPRELDSPIELPEVKPSFSLWLTTNYTQVLLPIGGDAGTSVLLWLGIAQTMLCWHAFVERRMEAEVVGGVLVTLSELARSQS